MKLDKFLSVLIQTGQDVSYSEKYKEIGLVALFNLPELSDLLTTLPGAVFNKGLFKIHNIGSSYFWTQLSFEYFKKYKANSYCFAFDWTGRQYAVNYSNGITKILLLDPATAEVFELESDIKSFLTEELEEFKNGLLEAEKFSVYYSSLSEEFKFDQCLGFKQFLFLGGKDKLANIELIDMEVYWELNYQVYCKVKNLPAGTLVNLSI